MKRDSFRQFRANRSKLCGNCAFPQNFHTRKLGEIKVFFAVEGDRRWTHPEKLHFIFKNIKYFRNLNITSEITTGRYHNWPKIVNFIKNYNKNMFFLRQLLQSLTEKVTAKCVRSCERKKIQNDKFYYKVPQVFQSATVLIKTVRKIILAYLELSMEKSF